MHLILKIDLSPKFQVVDYSTVCLTVCKCECVCVQGVWGVYWRVGCGILHGFHMHYYFKF